MPKATLTFDLPKENEEFILAQRGSSYSVVLEELDNWLRQKYKYENQETISIVEVRDKMSELINDIVRD